MANWLTGKVIENRRHNDYLTALVIDVDPGGPRYPGDGSLARLVAEGPRRRDLVPAEKGVCVLRNGGIELEAARNVVEALIEGWPHVVLRCRTRVEVYPTVPVVPLLPGRLLLSAHHRAVYQQMGWKERAPGPGLVLRTPSPTTVKALCEGQLPFGSRWISSWRRVWGMPWA